MSVIARLEVIPAREGNMSEAVASAVEALDRFDVSYETTPTDTVIEADDPSEVFAAAETAHRAVADERVITSLEVDEHRGRRQNRHDRVASVERALGRPAERERRGAVSEPRQQGMAGSSRQSVRGSSQQRPPETELRRYHGPVPADQQGGSQSAGQRRGSPPTETRPTGSRGMDTSSRGMDSRYLGPQQSPPR
ncbi:hypothetical protein BRD15_03500 [Halobacteriales archaeon SW_6_65_15]|nr:MAG: hypothetical protein BRD15_03500 [Halobacteriales archaeon SW_6_65_15]